jgi:hypothetical protein
VPMLPWSAASHVTRVRISRQRWSCWDWEADITDVGQQLWGYGGSDAVQVQHVAPAIHSARSVGEEFVVGPKVRGATCLHPEPRPGWPSATRRPISCLVARDMPPVPSGRAPAGQCAVRPVGEHRPRRNIIHGGSLHLTGHSMRIVSAPPPTLIGAFHGSEG